jgi:hypothetical protein
MELVVLAICFAVLVSIIAAVYLVRRVQNKSWEDTIIRACHAGDLTKLRRLAKKGSMQGRSRPLCHAARNGDRLDVIRCLVKELGANVNQADADGCTPLFMAALEGHLELVRCLGKELGADVNQPDRYGCSPLYIAAEKGFVAIVRCLGKELDADVKQATQTGHTPLHIGAQCGHLAVVKCLVKELGSDVNRTAKMGESPFSAASLAKHEEVARWLEMNGAAAA